MTAPLASFLELVGGTELPAAASAWLLSLAEPLLIASLSPLCLALGVATLWLALAARG